MEQQKIGRSKIFGIVIAVFAVLPVALLGMILEDTDKSKNYVCQMPWSGKAEWDYKTTVGVAEALANSKTQWVPTIMMGNGSNGNAMDAVGLNMLLEISKKMGK